MKNRKHIKADDLMDCETLSDEEKESFPTEFEYLKAKVQALEKVVDLTQDILKENRLVKTIIEKAENINIEDETWVILNEEKED